MKYAKLIENNIEYAPKNKGSISNYNLDVELMIADGYKPVVDFTLEDNQVIEGWEEKDDMISPIISTIEIVEENIENHVKIARIAELRGKLAETDYITCKLVEAVDDEEFNELKEIYAETITQRREWRTEIDALLKELN